MIEINLLPNKKKKRVSEPVEGEKRIAIGMGIVAAAAALLFFVVHSPKTNELESQQGTNALLTSENRKLESEVSDVDALRAAFRIAQQQAEAIETLNNARSTPANFLFELATILKPTGRPTMTEVMAKEVDENENLSWQEEWDPKHVWITSLVEHEGRFVMSGSAQSDGDVTQLAHRLNASVYFDNVRPEKSEKEGAAPGGISVFNFKITGKVKY